MSIPVIKLSGDVNDEVIYAIHKDLKAIIEDGYEGKIVLDLTMVNKMDSRALGALVSMWRVLDTDKNDLLMYKPQGQVRRILRETNLHRILKIVEDY